MSANPESNQTFTSVIKFTENGTYFQPVGNTNEEYRIEGREILNILSILFQNIEE